MHLAIVSDEITRDFAAAVEIATNWGIERFELRFLPEGRIPRLPDLARTKRIIREVVKDYGVRIVGLSPGLFKVSLNDPQAIADHSGKLLDESCALAEDLNCLKIIAFGVKRFDQEPAFHHQRVIEILGAAAAKCQQRGITLLLENEPGWWCDTAGNTASIVKTINNPALKINWDPGNSIIAGDVPYPDGYLKIKDFIGNLHIKDYQKDKSGRTSFRNCCIVGEGSIDWRGQLKAILKDRLLDYVTIETHFEPYVQNSKKSALALKKILSEIR